MICYQFEKAEIERVIIYQTNKNIRYKIHIQFLIKNILSILSPTKIIECLLIYLLQRNYNKHVEKWGAEWLRVGSTLTLKPDLDNANVGMISLLYVSRRLGFSAAFCFLIRIWRQIGGTTLCRIKKVMQEGDRK